MKIDKIGYYEDESGKEVFVGYIETAFAYGQNADGGNCYWLVNSGAWHGGQVAGNIVALNSAQVTKTYIDQFSADTILGKIDGRWKIMKSRCGQAGEWVDEAEELPEDIRSLFYPSALPVNCFVDFLGTGYNTVAISMPEMSIGVANATAKIIVDLCNRGQKINAIKELRGDTGLGLKACKNIIENLFGQIEAKKKVAAVDYLKNLQQKVLKENPEAAKLLDEIINKK